MNADFSKTAVLKTIKEYTLISIGLVMYSFAWTGILIPADVMGGGINGVGLLIYYATGGTNGGVPLGLSFLVLNSVLVAVSSVLVGLRFGAKTIYAIVFISAAMSVMQGLIPNNLLGLGNDKLLSVILGGAVAGGGIGICFTQGGSTGGTDIIAMILKKYSTLNIGMALFLVDLGITVAASLVFDIETGLFSFCGLMAKSLVIDGVIENINLCKYFTIVCENPEPICTFIQNELKRGATIYHAEGAYAHKEKTIILTVMKRSQAVQLRNFIHKTEPGAFIAITNSSEIIGKGFRGLN